MYSMINGELLTTKEAKISITDLSIQRGYGIFDFFKIENHQPCYLQWHLERFYQSAEAMRLPVDVSLSELEAMIFQLMSKNDLPDSGIKITLTGGYSEDGYSISKPNLLITQNPLVLNKTISPTGTRLVTYDHQRQLPQVKTIDYLQAIYLQPFIKEHHADDVLYCHQGEMRECPRSNFFIVTAADEIITPANEILRGITRKRILDLKGFGIKEAPITLEQLATAKEAFITSTTKNILPVVNINSKTIGNGKPGKITTEIYNAVVGSSY